MVNHLDFFPQQVQHLGQGQAGVDGIAVRAEVRSNAYVPAGLYLPGYLKFYHPAYFLQRVE